MSRPDCGRTTAITPRARCWNSSGSPAAKSPAICPAARRGARRWRGFWPPSPDILLLDEPTNHLDLTTIEWLERALDASRAALVLISHDRRLLSTLSRSTVWLDRGSTRRLDRGFSHFEEWRDAVLAEEEREQHKLGRKIVAEEHWLRYGVTGRRKRNMRRVGELRALRDERRNYRAAAGNATMIAAPQRRRGRW